MPSSILTPRKKIHPVTGCRVDTLFGLWCCEITALESYRTTAMYYVENNLLGQLKADATSDGESPVEAQPYTVTNKLAEMSISGPITKYQTSFQSLFGGISTKYLEKVISDISLEVDKGNIKGLLVDIDTPGGTVQGTDAAYSAFKTLSRKIPVIFHAEDTCCSGGIWLAMSGTHFSASRSATIGSVGSYAVLYDTSKRMEKSDVKPVLISVGEFKAIGAEGFPITEEHKKELSRLISDRTKVFQDVVLSGRSLDAKITPEIVNEILTARVFVGEDAKRVKLVDSVSSLAEARDNAYKLISGNYGRPGKDSLMADRSYVMDPELFQKISAITGQAVTAENAMDVLMKHNEGLKSEIATLKGQVTTLQASVPAKLPDNVASGYTRLFCKEVDGLVKSDNITAVQASLIKEAVVADQATFAPKAGAVSSEGDIFVSSSVLMKVLESSKTGGLNADASAGQPAPKSIPGSEKKEETPVSKERTSQLLAHV